MVNSSSLILDKLLRNYIGVNCPCCVMFHRRSENVAKDSFVFVGSLSNEKKNLREHQVLFLSSHPSCVCVHSMICNYPAGLKHLYCPIMTLSPWTQQSKLCRESQWIPTSWQTGVSQQVADNMTSLFNLLLLTLCKSLLGLWETKDNIQPEFLNVYTKFINTVYRIFSGKIQINTCLSCGHQREPFNTEKYEEF